MKFNVISDFIDKNSSQYYKDGSVFETEDKDRAAFLQKEGFIEESEDSAVKNEFEVLLDKTAAEIIDSLPGDFSKEDLEQLLSKEKDAKKPRKTVIEHIEGLLKGEENESGEA